MANATGRSLEASTPKRTIRVSPNNIIKNNRDRNNVNGHVTVYFNDVLGEPMSFPQTVDCVWEFSVIAFDCFKTCCYQMAGLFCGVCFAIYWGLQLVPVLFAHIWCLTPCKQTFRVVVGLWGRWICTLCTECCVSPCTTACGYFFHNCGYGIKHKPEIPSFFPERSNRKPFQKAIESKKEPLKAKEAPAIVPVKGVFDDYDKDKICQSIRRQMMLVWFRGTFITLSRLKIFTFEIRVDGRR